jgi:hypothetical protein
MTAIPEESTMNEPTSLTILGWLLIILDAGNLVMQRSAYIARWNF